MLFFFFFFLAQLQVVNVVGKATTILDEDWKKAGVRAVEPWIGVRADMVTIRDWNYTSDDVYAKAALVLSEGSTYACSILKFSLEDCGNLVRTELNYLKEKVPEKYEGIERRIAVAGLEPAIVFIYDKFVDSRGRLTKLCHSRNLTTRDCAVLHRLVQKEFYTGEATSCKQQLSSFLGTFPADMVEGNYIRHDAFDNFEEPWLFSSSESFDLLSPDDLKVVVNVGSAKVVEGLTETLFDASILDKRKKVDLLRIDAKNALSLLKKSLMNVDLILFDYGEAWTRLSNDTSNENLEDIAKKLIQQSFDVYLLGHVDEKEVALLDLSCWLPQYETWSDSTILAIQKTKALAKTLKDHAKTWADHATPCTVAINVGQENNAYLQLQRRDSPSLWRRAASHFATKYNLQQGAGCESQACIVDRLLDFSLQECGFSHHHHTQEDHDDAPPTHEGGEL